MKYDRYIVSYTRGTSGNFITQVLDRMIVGYNPIIFGKNNNCHISQPFTGIGHSNAWNDTTIYEYFEFQGSWVRDYKFSNILTTHVYPKFDLINARHSNIGIILIKMNASDYPEVVMNQKHKITRMSDNYTPLDIKRFSRFIEDDDYPENCLTIQYKDIFLPYEQSFKALTQLENFTNLVASDEIINDYKTYVSNQESMRNQYLNKLR